MQRLEDKVEARDITQRFEVVQASNISGFAIARGCSALDDLSESYGGGMDLIHLPQEAGDAMSASTSIFQVYEGIRPF